MKQLRFVFAAVLGLLWAGRVLAGGSVVVESKVLPAGSSQVSVAVRLANTETIVTLVVPLVIREVSGGCYITTLQMRWRERLARPGSPLSLVVVQNQRPEPNGTCKLGGFAGPLSGSDTLPHAVVASPEGALLVRGSSGLPGDDLPPGADVTGSILLTMTLNGSSGTFEIDTTCVDPANHLMFVRPDITGFTPSFTKGVVEVREANSVIVVSKIVPACSSQVTVPIRISNADTLQGLVIPLDIREVSGGCYITSLQMRWRERLALPGGPLTLVAVQNQRSTPNGTCRPGAFSSLTVASDTFPHPVGSSPEGALLARIASGASNDLLPGLDVTGSILLTMTLNGTPGTFEIDTTCVDPSNHLLFDREGMLSIVPTFTKGVIEVHSTTVTNLNNSGPGSLRDAIEQANTCSGPDTITFAVSGTIQPLTPLPPIADTSDPIIILGFTAPGAESPDGPTVVLDGSLSTPGSGLRIFTDRNWVEGLTIRNFHSTGIDVVSGAFNTITANRIHSNAGIGIDLIENGGIPGVTLNDPGDIDMGANFLANYPVIDTIHLVTGDTLYYVAGTASIYATVELFLAERYLGADTTADSSGHGEAWRYLGSDTADDVTGHWAFPAVYSRGWSWITATTTDTSGNTSEFSENRRLIPDSLIYTAYSPVHLVVITPDGQDSVGLGFNTIGATTSYDETTDWGPGPDGIPGKADDRITVTNIQPGEYIVKIITDPGGSGNYFFGIRVDGTEAKWAHTDATGQDTTRQFQSTPFSNTVPPPGVEVVVGMTPAAPRRGDLIADGVYNIQDVVEEVNYAFRSKPLPHPALLADVNCDGFACNIQDVVKLIDTVFRGGAEPCP